jgi:primosomal protein N' (replication factor Y) (superfamily II helicase)
VVPEVSGIDKVFDYLVPESLVPRVGRGTRVRIDLNGRRVGGWIVEIGSADERTDVQVDINRLVPIVSVSGDGVEPEVVPLTQWMSQHWFGSWRATLSSASAPRMRGRHVNPRRGQNPTFPDDEVTTATRDLVSRGGGGVLMVPPLTSALHVVAELARDGSVLVVCPTQRMAVMGAAALRRRGFTTALVPDDWDAAKSGVDIVIGARSAVLAPCAGLTSIVVIDEHDELHHEERAPTWNAPEVARERARRANVPCVLTSPVPSAAALLTGADVVRSSHGESGWPAIVIVNLDDVPVSGSLLSTELLSSATTPGMTTVCVLNTKGKARLIACKSCRAVQACGECSSLLTQSDDGVLFCVRCQSTAGSVCVSCGRTSFVVPRGGVSQLVAQVMKSTRNPVIEVTAESDDTWTKGSVFIGTEAVLYRIPATDVVVFADIDRDLGAPRITASREVLSLVARAARIVGPHGRVVIQTRQPQHPLLQALAATDPSTALIGWMQKDIAQRQAFSLPPFSSMVRVSVAAPKSLDDVPSLSNVDVARDDDSLVVKSVDNAALAAAVQTLRQHYGTALRVHAGPKRY